jgi:hypothetical protein
MGSRRGTAAVAAMSVGVGLIWAGLAARAGDDVELKRHLAEQQAQADDPSRPMPDRERVALGMAATLDRAAQAEATGEQRRARWAEAAAVLEGFNDRNPRHPQADAFALQAAVYRWARGQSWSQQAEFDPTDTRARAGAIATLDAAIARLRPLEESVATDPDSPLAQNVRYRLARALADRASFEPPGSAAAKADLERALALLTRPPGERSLRGFVDLLRAELLARLGRFEPAQVALDAAAKADPPPPDPELREARVSILLGLKRFDEGLKVAESAPKGERPDPSLAVRVRLAERATLPAGPTRASAEADAFRRAVAARSAGAAEARPALLALARALDEPPPDLGPDAWDALAEGHLLLGHPAIAARLARRGAERAEALGQPERANALRYRAGALWFRAGQFAEADAILSRLAADRAAGPLRPRAGLLRALARGRVADAARPGPARDAYLAALADQIRDFPNDPGADEARWLLGRARLDDGDRAEARTLWSAIGPRSPRRLDARLAVASLLQQEVEIQRLSGDRGEISHKMELARIFLDNLTGETRGDLARAEVDLARASLELLPEVGDPEEARRIGERVGREATHQDLRRRGRQARVVALAEIGRYLEAERGLGEALPGAGPGELLEMARRLDRFAAASDSDLVRRRLGALLRTVAGRALESADSPAPAESAEARLRQARGLLFAGDPDAARNAIASWQPPPEPIPDGLLHDLADLYAQLGAHPLAIDGFRLLMQRRRPGSLPWFEARYRLALAYHGSDRDDEARRLIDATAILHPDLGGGQLRTRFERLRGLLTHD